MASGRIPYSNLLFLLEVVFTLLVAIRVALPADQSLLPRPPCVAAESHLQLFANPPLGVVYIYGWRKDNPEEKELLTRTRMVGECFLITKSYFNRNSRSIKWDDGICVTMTTPDGSAHVEGCNR